MKATAGRRSLMWLLVATCVSLSKAENLSRITSLPLLEQVATTASAATSEGNDVSLADSLIRNLSQNLMEHVMESSPQQVIQSNDDDDGTNSFSLLRMLEVGDFEDLNELFEGAVINLPDADISTSGLTLEVRNLRCKEISIGDIQVGYQKNSNQQLTFQLEVIDLDLKCYMDYNYKYAFFRGSGSAVARTDNNSAEMSLAFFSPNFNYAPPNRAETLDVAVDINVVKMDFSGGFVAFLLDLFQSLLSGTVESEVEDLALDELSSLGDTLVKDLLEVAAEAINQYLGAPLNLDPLASERALVLPDDIELLNFQDTDTTIGSWFGDILESADAFLGDYREDPNGPTDVVEDLGVNIFLREFLLDEDRALVANMDDLFENDLILYDGHDKLTETMITLDSVKVFGLDTFTTFEPLIGLGNYTLQNNISLDYLTIELGVTIDIKASTLEDSLLEDPSPVNIIERVNIDFGIEKVDAIISLLIAIDQEELGAMKLGSVLRTDAILTCLLSTIFKVELSELSITVENVIEPTLGNFVTSGIDRILSQAVKAFFQMYEELLKQAMPQFFQSKVKEFVNDKIIGNYLTDPDNVLCDTNSDLEGVVDFRDLLLTPELALDFGATGTQPYGDLAATLVEQAQAAFTSVGEDGMSNVNSLINSFTADQSGIEGTLQFPSTLFDMMISNITDTFWSSVIESFQLSLSDLSIWNINTVTDPLLLLQPSSDPRSLIFAIPMGPVQSRPFGVSVRLLAELEGENSPLSFRNEMTISMSVPVSLYEAVIFAEITAEKFMGFPLKDIMNYHCWLATVSSPALDDNGNLVDPNADFVLGVETFFAMIRNLSFGVDCASTCTSSGVSTVLPVALAILEETGMVNLFRSRIEPVAKELLEGDWLQLSLARVLSEAPKMCPHDLAYEEGEVAVDYGIADLTNVSRDFVETFIIAVSMIINVGIPVVAGSHLEPIELTDPLSAQLALLNSSTVPPESNFFDFTNLSASIGSWADLALEEVQEYLSGTVKDPATGEQDLTVNKFLRDNLLGDDGVFVAAFDDELSFQFAGVKMGLSEVRISGLDSLSKFDVLNAIGSQTLQNTLKFERLQFEAVISVNMNPNLLTNNVEEITLSFGVSDLEINVAVLLAFDLSNMGKLELGSMLYTKQIIPCLLSAVFDVHVPQMKVNIGSIDEPEIKGFVSDTIQTEITTSIETVFNKFRSDIVTAIPNIFDSQIRSLLNSAIQMYIDQKLNISCPSVATVWPSFGILDFRDLLLSTSKAIELGGSGNSPYGNLVRDLFRFLQEKFLTVDESSGISAVNELIAPLTKAQSNVSGTFAYPGDLFSTDTQLEVGGLKARIELKASYFRIEGLDTVGTPLEVLQPIFNDPSILNNTATFGVGTKPIRVSVRVLVALTGDENLQLRDEVDISLDMANITVVIATLMKISEEPFLSFPLQDMLNVNCWLATMKAPLLDSSGVSLPGSDLTLALSQLAVAVSKVGLNVTCVSCTSPGIDSLAGLLSSPEGGEDATAVANMVLNYAVELLGGNFFQVPVDRLLNSAAEKCPHNTAYKTKVFEAEYDAFKTDGYAEESISFLVAIATVAGCILVVVAIILTVVKWIVRRRHRAWLKSIPSTEVLNLYNEQMREQEANARSSAMFFSEDVPLFARYFVPFVILCNIGFFLSGHLNLGATVNIEATIAGESFTIDNFFSFSMAKSTVDIWNAGGKELAIMILIFSGVWPYTKQSITFVVWFLPPRIMSTTTRGKVLHWMDVLGKWSMIDIFVLVVSIASFRVKVGSPNVAFLTKDFYNIDLLVVPTWGLYANMIAQLLSQVSSHFIIHYHRRIVAAADRATTKSEHHGSGAEILIGEEGYQDESRDVLCTHAFIRPHRGDTNKLQVYRPAHAGVIIAAIVTASLVICGCSLHSFSLETLGVIGVAVESGNQFEEAVTKHSVFSIVALLMEEAKFLDTAGDYIGIGTLTVLFILTIVVVPLFQTVLLVRQWFAPLTRKSRKRISDIIEILQAWQYVEVYLIAVVVAAWQIGPVSEFMINDYCDDLDDVFSTLVFYGLLDETDAQCFMVVASLEKGSYILATAAIILALLSTFVVKATVQYSKDKNVLKTAVQHNLKLSSIEDGDAIEAMQKIQPTPVMFTDQFRWLLRREEDPTLLMPSFPKCMDDGTVESDSATRPVIAVVQNEDDKNPTAIGQTEEEEETSYIQNNPLIDNIRFEAALDDAFGSDSDKILIEDEGLPLDALDEMCDRRGNVVTETAHQIE